MNSLSPYQTAAILILVRMLSLSLYEPLPNENTVLTAAAALILCAVKWLLLMPAVRVISSRQLFCSRAAANIISLMTVAGAAALLLVITDSFASLLEAVSPERYSRFGITVVLLLVCAYTASMGRQGLARTAVLMLPVFLGILAVIFFELRGSMLPDRMSLYSPDPLSEAAVSAVRLSGGSADLFLAVTLIPFTSKPKSRSAAIYLAADAVMSLIFFLMCGSVLGRWRSRSGSLWFTLADCTRGSVIDRSGAVFLAVSTSCAVITCAALLMVLTRSLKLLTGAKSPNILMSGTAALLSALLLALGARGLYPRLVSLPVCTGVSAAAAAAALTSPLYALRKEREG